MTTPLSPECRIQWSSISDIFLLGCEQIPKVHSETQVQVNRGQRSSTQVNSSRQPFSLTKIAPSHFILFHHFYSIGAQDSLGQAIFEVISRKIIWVLFNQSLSISSIIVFQNLSKIKISRWVWDFSPNFKISNFIILNPFHDLLLMGF